MENKKGIFREFLEEMKREDDQSHLTMDEAAHPLHLLQRENRLWEKKLDALSVRLVQVNEDKRWRDFLVHLETLADLRLHYEKIERLFPYAEPVAEQLYMQHLIRSEQEEILAMIDELGEESFLLGKSTVEKSLFLEHLFHRIRQGMAREETRLFEDLKIFVEKEKWQIIYYELIDQGFLFSDIPEFFKEEGSYVSEELTKEHLEAAMRALEKPLSLRGADGKRLLRLGKFPMSDEANESALQHVREARQEMWHTRRVTVREQLITYISLWDARGNYMGLFELLEEE